MIFFNLDIKHTTLPYMGVSVNSSLWDQCKQQILALCFQSGDVGAVACFRHACRLLGISMLRQHELAVMLKGSILLPPSPNQLLLCRPVSCSMQRARGNNWLGFKLTQKVMKNSFNPQQLLS